MNDSRLDEIALQLNDLTHKIGVIHDLLVNQATRRDWYTTEEVANLLNKAEFTVREYCRQGRLAAQKRAHGRGKHQSWVIAHIELERYRRDGLRPDLSKPVSSV